MGLCCSCECWKTCCVSDWELRYREVFHAHEEELRALRFEIDETRKMYQVFVSIDRKALGWISYKKVLAYCKINETPFVRSIFVVFDKRKTEHICFRDFFMIIYDYCTLAPQQLGELSSV
jgi:Ca2+-binding EF-hand superfamily protein